MTSRPFPILFIAPSRIGDAVLASGLVKVLADRIPQARFTFVGSDLTAPLFADAPALDGLIAMEKRPLSQHWLGLWSKARAVRWGLIVDLRGGAISSFLRRSRRAVWRKSGVHEHKVMEVARLLDLADDPPWPFLFTAHETEARAESLTAGTGPILAIAPAANWIGKAWPAERFAAVARRLLGRGGPLDGGRLMVLGGAADRDAANTVLAAVVGQRQIDLAGREPLLVSYAALKRARLFIGNDSGVMHLAAAAGIPTLGLFGPSDEQVYGPWGDRAKAVRGPRPFSAFVDIDPTLSRPVCHMSDLSIGAVIEAAELLLTHPEARDA
ncbi:MAG TPA: glycosyltransferase family 9 protein [Caulobacteraceae bacterium]